MKVDREKLIYDLAMCNATAAATSQNINGRSFNPIDIAEYFALAYQVYNEPKGKQTIDAVLEKIKGRNI